MRGACALTATGCFAAELQEHAGAPRPGDYFGQLHRFINVYANDEDVRYLEGVDTKVKDGDTVAILPAVAGG